MFPKKTARLNEWAHLHGSSILILIAIWGVATFSEHQHINYVVLLFAGTGFFFSAWRSFRGGVDLSRLLIREREFFKIALVSVIFAFWSVLCRDALNMFDVEQNHFFENSVIPSHFFETSHPWVVVYDKSEIKRIIIHFLTSFLICLLTLLFAVVQKKAAVMQSVSLEILGLLGLIPFYCFVLPPYAMEFSHWTSWIGPSLDLEKGKWPIFGTQSQYGFWPPLVLFGWSKIFGNSVNSYAALICLLNAFTAVLTYRLVVMLAVHRWLALFLVIWVHVCFFPHVGDSVMYPNLGPIRSVLPALIALFGFAKVIPGWKANNAWYVCLGLVTLWEPATGFFVALAVVTTLIYLAVNFGLGAIVQPTTGYVLGAAFPIVLVMGFTEHDSFLKIIIDILDHYRFYGDGFGNTEQTIKYYEIPLYLLLLILLQFIVVRAVAKKVYPRLQLTIVALLISLPFVMQNFSRTHNNLGTVIWILLPVIGAWSVTIYRLAGKKAIAGVGILLIFAMAPSFNFLGTAFQRIADWIVTYESARFQWAIECDQRLFKNQKCLSEARPSMARYLAEGQQSFFDLHHADSLEVEMMGSACRNHIPIISVRDVLVYARHRCMTPGRFNSYNLVVTRRQMAEYLDFVTNGNDLLLDTTISGFPTDNKIRFFREAFASRGYRETEACGKLVFYSRGKRGPTTQNLCGQPTVEFSGPGILEKTAKNVRIFKRFKQLNPLGVNLGKLTLAKKFRLDILLKPTASERLNAHVLGNHGNFMLGDRLHYTGLALQHSSANSYTLLFGTGKTFMLLDGIKLTADRFARLVIAREGDSLAVTVDGKTVSSAIVPGDSPVSKNDFYLGNWQFASRPFRGEIREILITGE